MTTVLGTSSASAFSCAQRDARDLAREANVVVGGVIQAESVFGIRVRVDRVYKGTAEQTVTVLPGQGNANRVGQPWIFYLGRSGIAYDHTDCGGSHPNGLTPEEGNLFGAGSVPTSDQQLFGQVGNVAAGLGVRAGSGVPDDAPPTSAPDASRRTSVARQRYPEARIDLSLFVPPVHAQLERQHDLVEARSYGE